MQDIRFEQATSFKQKPQDESKMGFGKLFTDYMFEMDYSVEKGWHDPRVVPYHNFSMDPATSVLHYGQEIFEGMKCYRRKDGGLQLFRPRDNFKRMNRSAERMAIPQFDEDVAMAGLEKLLEVEKDWVPHTQGATLYIRPTIIAMDAMLGVHAAHTYKFYIILSPSGAYYAGGLAPVDIYVEDKYVRAVRGGIGFAKTGGNYAASILAGMNAKHIGYAQVLWLDGVHQRYIEEVGAMNMMFVYEDRRIVTPVLNGSILPGITRDSVLKLGKHLGYETEEARMDIHDVIADIKAGRVTEAFGTGTAAVVSPVNKIRFQGEEIGIGDGGIGHITQQLYDVLTGIQFGKTEDPMGWVVHLK